MSVELHPCFFFDDDAELRSSSVRDVKSLSSTAALLVIELKRYLGNTKYRAESLIPVQFGGNLLCWLAVFDASKQEAKCFHLGGAFTKVCREIIVSNLISTSN